MKKLLLLFAMLFANFVHTAQARQLAKALELTRELRRVAPAQPQPAPAPLPVPVAMPAPAPVQVSWWNPFNWFDRMPKEQPKNAQVAQQAKVLLPGQAINLAEENCMICQAALNELGVGSQDNPTGNIVQTECRHYFCQQDLDAFRRQPQNLIRCPLCRAQPIRVRNINRAINQPEGELIEVVALPPEGNDQANDDGGIPAVDCGGGQVQVGNLPGNQPYVETKECPQCHVDIQKISGCNHMHCTNCDKHFCWLCLGDWVGYDRHDAFGNGPCRIAQNHRRITELEVNIGHLQRDIVRQRRANLNVGAIENRLLRLQRELGLVQRGFADDRIARIVDLDQRIRNLEQDIAQQSSIGLNVTRARNTLADLRNRLAREEGH
jgi:hypothetical protein